MVYRHGLFFGQISLGKKKDKKQIQSTWGLVSQLVVGKTCLLVSHYPLMKKERKTHSTRFMKKANKPYQF